MAHAKAVSQCQTQFPITTVVCRLRLKGISLDDDLVTELASELQVASERIHRIDAWIHRLISTTDTAEPLFFCKSVSCTQNGAAALDAQLIPDLKALGCRLEIKTVHCLAQCENGPSVGFGDEVFVGREEKIVRDERGWRPDPMVEDAG